MLPAAGRWHWATARRCGACSLRPPPWRPKPPRSRWRLTTRRDIGIPNSANGHGDVDPLAPPIRCSDTGNAQRLVLRFGAQFRYDVDAGAYRINDGMRWVLDRDGGMMRMAKATARAIHHEGQDSDDDA